jgi:uncharacterized protein YcgI (DUF1989 family)
VEIDLISASANCIFVMLNESNVYCNIDIWMSVATQGHYTSLYIW